MKFGHFSLAFPGSASTGIGCDERVRSEFEEFEVLELDILQGSSESSAEGGDEDEYADEFGGHHQGSGARGLPLFPSGDLRFGGREVQAHGPFHEPPDQQCKDEHEPEGFDTPRGFEKQGIDKDRILEKSKVVLHGVLVLVDREQLPGRDGAGPFSGRITD